MPEYNYINDLLSNDLPKMFHLLSDKGILISDTKMHDFSIETFQFHEYDFADECKQYFRYLVKNSLDSKKLHNKLIDNQVLVINEFSSLLYSKFYKIQKEEDFYNDLSSLFETEEGKKSFLKEIDLQKEDYKKIHTGCNAYIVKYNSVELLFYIILLQYIIKTYNRESINFIDINGRVETEFVSELIINFYNESLLLYLEEINRIERISKILDIVMESFLEYKKVSGEDRALKLFGDFIEKDKKNLQYKFKEYRDKKYFLNFHEIYLYLLINRELLQTIYINRGRFTGNFRVSHAEEILFKNFSKSKYKKILVKINSLGEKKILYNNFEENFISIEYISENINYCLINKNKLFLYPSDISKNEYFDFKKSITSNSVLDFKLKEGIQYLITIKFNFKNYEKSYRDTFIDLILKFTKCITKQKPAPIMNYGKKESNAVDLGKDRFSPNNKSTFFDRNIKKAFKNVPILSKLTNEKESITLERSMSSESSTLDRSTSSGSMKGNDALKKSYQNKFYEKRLFLVAKSGGINLQTDQISIDLKKIIQFSDPYVLNEQNLSVLQVASQSLNHDFIKNYLEIIHELKINYNSNFLNPEGLSAIQILFISVFNASSVSILKKDNYLLTIKRLMKYTFQSKYIQNIKIDIPIDEYLNTPLHKAVLLNSDAMLALFLEYADQSSVKTAIQMKNMEGKTGIELCSNKKSKIYEMLSTKLNSSNILYKAKYEPQKKLVGAVNYITKKI
ncbi:hypothetical protein QEJ31_01330 [Pigmentibacter sp. JX0631]|uniref:hypothetical protein n=1 Tax=Pigmentibacter sp. JX0631 TaxID=2976982 RepID=UPI002469645F|nr:hypothetical protein [Pigmentibacter sp. JX0631]WGL60246.1 hypothetical protein QEJ31_01330 [Pigmentibacter sp. JX0631]